jgi:hypothetical protein
VESIAETAMAIRIVRGREGRSWVVLPGEDAWARREPFQPGESTELEPVPGHCPDMLGLPA